MRFVVLSHESWDWGCWDGAAALDGASRGAAAIASATIGSVAPPA